MKELEANKSDLPEWVERTGSPEDFALLSEMLRDPLSFSRSEFIRTLQENYSGVAYGERHWRKYDGGWTTPKVPTDYGILCDRFPELSKWALDAGIMTHLPELMEDSARLSPEILNEKKNSLGYVDVWRGTMLTETELEAVLRDGFSSAFILNRPGDVRQALDIFEHTVLATNPSRLAEEHFHGGNPFISPFVSVSMRKDVAIAVGRRFAHKAPGKKTAVFKVRIPRIDLIHFSDHAIRKPSILDRVNSVLSISIEDEEIRIPFDSDVERYVFWKIDPSEIVDYECPDIRKTSCFGRVTET